MTLDPGFMLCKLDGFPACVIKQINLRFFTLPLGDKGNIFSIRRPDAAFFSVFAVCHLKHIRAIGVHPPDVRNGAVPFPVGIALGEKELAAVGRKPQIRYSLDIDRIHKSHGFLLSGIKRGTRNQ